MADSPPYSDPPGDDLSSPRFASPPWWTRDGDQAAPGAATGQPPPGIAEADMKVAPLSPESPSTGTGGHRRPVPPDGTGPHPLPVPSDGSGPHKLPFPPDGSGPHRLPVSSTGTGPHALPRMSGTGPQMLPVPPDGTGPQIAVQALPAWDGAGQVPPGLPAQAPGKGRRSLNGLLLVVGAGAFLVIVLIAGFLAFQKGGGSTNSAQVLASKKRIVAATTAGGLRRDAAAPATSAAYPFISAGILAGGVPTAKDGTAVYTDALNGTRNFLFMGGTGRVGDPAAFLQKARPTTYISGVNTTPGAGGGKAVCGSFAVLSDVHLFCSWATKDSYGVIASDVPLAAVQAPSQTGRAGQAPGAAQAAQITAMADLMRRMRADLEKPK